MRRSSGLLALVLVAGCGSAPDSGSVEPPTPPDTGAPLPPEEPSIVVSHDGGLALFDLDGSERLGWTWEALAPGCAVAGAVCFGEGLQADGDGLLFVHSTASQYVVDGGLGRMSAPGQVDFLLTGFDFPHDVVRAPDEQLVLVESFGSRLSWLAGDGSSATRAQVLDASHSDWALETPNSVARFDQNGRTYVVVADRGSLLQVGASGVIELWDITEPTPARVWRFPDGSPLNIPHGAELQLHDGRIWLTYGHTLGDEGRSSTIGVAVTDDVTQLPAYVADLVPSPALTFLRGVSLHDGVLYLAESGESGEGPGIYTATLPDLAESKHAGGFGDQQRVELSVRLHIDVPEGPYEAWVWDEPPW